MHGGAEQNEKTRGDFRGTFGAELFHAVHLCAFCSFLGFLELAGKSFIF